MKIHKYTFLALVVLTLVGCDNISKSINPPTADNMQNAYALIVGVADGKVAGPCPGSDVDANTFQSICNEKKIASIKLVNGQGTYNAVKTKLTEICNSYDTAIFYYSGHGGRAGTNFNPYAGEEADHVDDFLCLYDKAMLDDNIWKIISKAKGRVICVFDCCHSSSMYRAPLFTDKIKFGAPIMTNFVDAVNTGGIFVIAGSPEDAYSYGSVAGGQLTNAIRRHYKNQTYLSLFELLENDKELRSYQRPICTIINGFNADIEFLR